MTEQSPQCTRKNIEAHILAPTWKDEAYKQELLSNPKVVIEREFDVQPPAQISVQVVEENPNNLYFVLPTHSDSSEAELSNEQLDQSLVGLLHQTLYNSHHSVPLSVL